MKQLIVKVEKLIFFKKTSFLACCLLVSGLILFLAFLFTPSIQALTMEEVAREIMSPACPGQLLIDCPSGKAGNCGS